MASLKQGFPLCTIYTNLGEEAVVHGINQTKVPYTNDVRKIFGFFDPSPEINVLKIRKIGGFLDTPLLKTEKVFPAQ